MGVPALFRWLTKKYPKIISPVVEEQPLEIDGVKVPVDTTKPNPNGEELHNLYLDFNGIVHPCSHPENEPPPANESEMMMAIFKYTERVVNMVRPRRLLYIAIDGVAPRAKMNQQRARRFRSAMDAKENDEKKAELQVLLRQQRAARGEPEDLDQVVKKTWDSNVITPGTPFMFILAQSIRFWCQWKLNTDPAWADLKVIISDASVPGEGEHKIMQFIRSQRSDPEYDPNTRHVMYGLDADLIMLGIATHEPHFRVLREDVEIQNAKAKTCRLCGQPGHYADNCRGTAKEKSGEFDEKGSTPDLKPFVFLNVPILREYLGAEMYVPGQTFRFDLERALDDWVFMCFFVGNDFLPHLPSLDIHEDGIDKLIAIWRDNVPIMGGYLTCDGEVDLSRAQVILEGLAKQEDAIFRRRRETEERRERNQERRKRQDQGRQDQQDRDNKRRRSSPDYSRGARVPPSPAGAIDITSLPRTSDLNYNLVVNRGAAEKAIAANKSAAAMLKEKMLAQQNGTANEEEKAPDAESASALGKRTRELLADEINGEESDDTGTPGRTTPVTEAPPKKKFDPDNPPPDTVKLWEEGYADRYYEQKFHVSPSDIEFRHKVARSYVEGLSWVLLYYFQGCPSWTWYYPYHYAPFAADFVDLDKLTVTFDKGTPFRPYEQLMGVLPASSNHAIPKPFHPLMSDSDSPIIDFYPEDFDLDLNGKKQSWKAIVLLPFIDEKRLLSAMATKYPDLSEEEHMRNEPGKEALLVSERHPLYEDLQQHFYSRKALKEATSDQESKLSMRKFRLAGQVNKNPVFLPHMDLRGPEEDIVLSPLVDDDCTMSVFYDMPPKTHVHKSMLFPGVVLPPAVLDKSDLAILKSKARTSGRDYGGAPLYDNSRRDHMEQKQWSQGRVNYAADRAPLPHNGNGGGYTGAPPPPPPPDPRTLDPNNPFAAFLDPKFAPGMPRVPQPQMPSQAQGYPRNGAPGGGGGGYDRRDGYGGRQQHNNGGYGYQGGQQQHGYYPPANGGQQGGNGYGRGYQNGGNGYQQNQQNQQNQQQGQGGYYQGGGGRDGYGRR